MRDFLAKGSRRRAAWAVVAAVSGVLSCGRPSADPVRATLDGVVASVRARDAGALMENLAPDFTAADGTSRGEVESTVRRWLGAYESLDVDLSDLTIEKSESAALARFQAKLSGRPRQVAGLAGILPSASTWKFEVRLVPGPDAARWKIAWASWSQVS